MNTYVVCCSYSVDRKTVVDQIEKQGGFFCAILKVPFWNQWGDILSAQYAVVSQSKEELGIEVLT